MPTDDLRPSLARRLNRPEYVFQPSAVLQRMRRDGQVGTPSEAQEVALPWSQTITVLPDEMGRSIATTGIFDMETTETIYRLLDPGDATADVGANIGYLTNLMAVRAGPTGSVSAFEPHPTVFQVLERNAARWSADPRLASVHPDNLALSSSSGTGTLAGYSGFDDHTGLSALRDPGKAVSPTDVEVKLTTLDDLFGDGELQLLKIDVEGHEPEVLRGAEELIARHGVRDVVFEDHGVYPTPAMIFLEQHGMTVFTIYHSLLGPRVRPVREGPAAPGWPGPDYLATREPERAVERLRARGWRSLGFGRD